jgi:SAM-dependent methyltransferase
MTPASIASIDPSEAFVAFARQRLPDARVTVAVGHAEQLEAADASFDAAVSGLVLNFVPDPARAVREFARVARIDGIVGVYVWDYAADMQMLRLFWDAATALDPAAAQFDEAATFSICRPEPLRQIFADAGLVRVEDRAIDVPTEWLDFDAFWSPFLGGTGTAPAYVASLNDESRDALRERLRASVPVADDGRVRLVARAWAIKGCRP